VGAGSAVVFNLKTPPVKSRGRGRSEGAAGPLPCPSGPWHTAQCCAYTRSPAEALGRKSLPGGHRIATA